METKERVCHGLMAHPFFCLYLADLHPFYPSSRWCRCYTFYIKRRKNRVRIKWTSLNQFSESPRKRYRKAENFRSIRDLSDFIRNHLKKKLLFAERNQKFNRHNSLIYNKIRIFAARFSISYVEIQKNETI